MGVSNLEEMDERLQRIEGIAQQLLRVSNQLLESNIEMSNALTACRHASTCVRRCRPHRQTNT